MVPRFALAALTLATATFAGDIEDGKALYKACGYCHGWTGQGSKVGRTRHIDFTSPTWHLSWTDTDLLKYLRGAESFTPCSARLSEGDSTRMLAWLRSLRRKPPVDPEELLGFGTTGR